MAIDLRHEGCGGFYQPWASRGQLKLFRCEKCGDDVETPYEDEEARARHEEVMRRRTAEFAALPKPPPRQPMRDLTEQEALVLGAYEAWSEEAYSAGFMTPDASSIASFRKWIQKRKLWEDYEAKMLAAWFAPHPEEV